MDKRLCCIRDYALFYLYETVESNTLQLGVFVTDVTITLAIETPRFFYCDCCSYAEVFWSVLKHVQTVRHSCRSIGGVYPLWTEVLL